MIFARFSDEKTWSRPINPISLFLNEIDVFEIFEIVKRVVIFLHVELDLFSHLLFDLGVTGDIDDHHL